MQKRLLRVFPLVGVLLGLGVTSLGSADSGGVPLSAALGVHEAPIQDTKPAVVSRLGVNVLAPHAATSNDYEAKRKKLEEKKAASKRKESELSAQLEGVKADLVELAVALQRTQDAIPVAQIELVSAQQQLQKSQRDLVTIQKRLKTAQNQKSKLQNDIEAGARIIAQTQVTIGQIAQQAYRGQKLETSPWTLLLDSKSADELAIRAQVVDHAAQSQNQIIQAAEEAKAEAANAKARQEAVTVRIGELETQARQAVAAADAAKQEEQKQLASLQTLQTQQAAQQNQLNSKKAEFEQEIKEQQAAQAETARQIAKLVEEARKMQNRVVTGGIFGAPLSALTRTSPFGWRTHPILRTRILHTGTDFGMPCGSPVFASQSGIARTTRNGVSGNLIFVNHGNINEIAWQTAYAHLSAFKVTTGQRVEKGQVIGLVGSTGRSTGCHLHFEVWKNGTPIDSYQVLQGRL